MSGDPRERGSGVLDGRSGASCRMLVIQNNITTIVLIGIALLLVAGALIGDRKRAAALVAAGLLMAFTALAIGVHAHGWITAFDAPTASWIGKAIHRSHGLDAASLMAARVGRPTVIAAAGLIGGALMSWRARSVRPVVIVIATVGAATLAATAIKAVVDRPLTQAEVLAPNLLSTNHHPFPSGHVGGHRRAARNHRRVHRGRTEPYCRGPAHSVGGYRCADRCLPPVVSGSPLAH